jgi:hypothetical protein
MNPGFTYPDPFGRGDNRVMMNPSPGSKQLARPAGSTDPEIPMLAVQALDGTPIALLANYALHYVGGVPNQFLSADYFGEFANQIAKRVAPSDSASTFVAILTNGTSGDVNNINFFAPWPAREPFEQIRLVADEVAASAFTAFRRIEYADWVPIHTSEAEIELGVRLPSAQDIDQAREVLAAAGPPPYSNIREIYTRETVLLAEFPPTVRVKLQAFRVGSLGIATSPCETFVETGLAVKKQSPFQPTMVIELANGYNGYLPPPEQHVLGGYETWRARSSYLAVDAEPKVRQTILELLSDVAAQVGPNTPLSK